MKFIHECWRVIKKLEQFMSVERNKPVYIQIVIQIVTRIIFKLIKHFTGY